MEKNNYSSDGGNKLPPGFRFQPTDEEIVFQYLARKTFSYPLPAQVIPDQINIFNSHPSHLPGSKDQDKYFFCNKEDNNSGNNNQNGFRPGCSGYWKDTGSSKRIFCSKRMPIVGIRKTLVFYHGNKQGRGFRTDWAMHEYYIALSENSGCNNSIQRRNYSQGSLVRIGNWTLCRIFIKKRSGIAEEDDDDYISRNFDLSSDADSSSASSSSPHWDSSNFAEVSSTTANHGDGFDQNIKM